MTKVLMIIDKLSSAQGEAMKQLVGRIILAVLLLITWLALTHPFTIQELITGSAVSLLITALPIPGVRIYGEIIPLPRRIFFGLVYIFVFLGAVIRSNLDVAFRVLHPRLPINPGIVRVRTRLKSRLGRLVLANSITLTPGTITVDIDGEDLYVHWLSMSKPDVEQDTNKIVGGFEKYLEVIFG
jgi:multicomponent Na+:H+ antiporter subunit E